MTSAEFSHLKNHGRYGVHNLSKAGLANMARQVCKALNGRSVVFVGIMGVGKSTIGRRVANLLDLPFTDADIEIEQAANLSISEIFDKFGEAYFRSGEQRVIERLLKQNQQVLATGGGAYMDEVTRNVIGETAVSIWLDADIELIMQRVSRRKTRPLLQQANPRQVIEGLLEKRNPVYAKADIKFVSHDVDRDIIANEIIARLDDALPQLKTPDEKPMEYKDE